ncbi:MAG TPA: response regulator [Candidatus Limnocylindria bacterium]|nr:response regulator [Candidatus Limnocylindria bacterium]
MGRVVFVEDDATIRKLVRVALRSTAHEVHFAANGREGLELVARVRPDVVFTDVAMPDMDGLQLADAMRARPDLAAIPIVIITASLQREQIQRYFAHGARTYLAKPFSTAQLREQVEKLVGTPR